MIIPFLRSLQSIVASLPSLQLIAREDWLCWLVKAEEISGD
jgi:hypothetical protein